MSEFENTKLTLSNYDEIQNIKDNPVVKATILSILNSVPIIGELIDNSIDAILTKFQQQKRSELLSIILKTDTVITAEMVNDVEFIINFAKTLEAVNRLATNDKVKYFANLLKNSYFKEEKTNNDEFEEYLHVLSDLSYREIDYLLFLYNYQSKHFLDYKDKHQYFWHFSKEFEQKFNTLAIDTLNIYKTLCSTGFVEEVLKTDSIYVERHKEDYLETYSGTPVNIYPEYYLITDNFTDFASMIKDKITDDT